MENDGPVAAVQIRLAKGEITPVQYREIITHLMKNISSFQQTSSLKTLQIRYAKGEVNVEQYREIFTTLMKNLSTLSWSPPLQIIHERYAEGEMSTEQYLEMISHLTHQQFTYDQSTPLWILNNRYARGELSTEEYEEVLALFTDFTLTLMQNSMIQSETERHSDTIPTRQDTQPVQRETEKQNLSKPQGISEQAVAPPEQKIQQPIVDDKASTTIKISDHKPEEKIGSLKTQQPNIVSEQEKKERPEGRIKIQKQVGEEKERERYGSVKDQSKSSGKIVETDKLKEIPLISIGEKGSKQPGSQSGLQHEKLPQGVSELDLSSEKRASGEAPSIFHQFPTSAGIPSNQLPEAEALPTSFLFHGGKQDHGEAVNVAPVPSIPQNQVNYSITPESITGSVGNTYQTVTSQISLTESAQSEDKKSSQPTKSYSEDEITDLRQKIKTNIVKGEYQEAIGIAEDLITIDNGDYLLFFYKGMANYYLHNHDTALQDLNNAKNLCTNSDELQKIETIINHISSKEDGSADSASDIRGEIDNPVSIDFPLYRDPSIQNSPIADELSQTLDILGKRAQDLINKQEFEEAEVALNDFIAKCESLSPERLKSESVDEIYSAMGYVRYQLKDYGKARECFQKALSINETNEVANQFMQDILIRAVRRKK